jgi:ferredoxin
MTDSKTRCRPPDAIISPVPDELCPHVELGAEMVGGFVFDAESPQVSIGMCEVCLAICQAEFITAEPFNLYRKNEMSDDYDKFKARKDALVEEERQRIIRGSKTASERVCVNHCGHDLKWVRNGFCWYGSVVLDIDPGCGHECFYESGAVPAATEASGERVCAGCKPHLAHKSACQVVIDTADYLDAP